MYFAAIFHDDVIKWKHFPRHVSGNSPVNSPHKGQWGGALMFSLICAWLNGWVNNDEAGNLRRHLAHYDVIVVVLFFRRHPENTPIFLYNKMSFIDTGPIVTLYHCQEKDTEVHRYGYNWPLSKHNKHRKSGTVRSYINIYIYIYCTTRPLQSLG